MPSTTNRPVYIIDSPRPLAPGILMPVWLDQIAGPHYRRRRGPHGVGKAEVMDDGRLAVWFTQASDAGRDARALVEDDMIDITVEGDPPEVWLRP
jgi:hypothetical protein